MNLFGKILVVLVTLLAIGFLAVAITAFTTHKNWHADIVGQNTQITALNAQLERLKSDYKRSEGNLELELESAQNQVIKLENERVALAQRNEQAQSQIDELAQQRRDLTTAVAQVQAINQRLGEENQQLQQTIASTLQATDAAFNETVKSTSELHEAKVMLESQLERNAQLVEQVGGNQ
jgi:chromosome segregation ATPase